jgi:hypothetical protein
VAIRRLIEMAEENKPWKINTTTIREDGVDVLLLQGFDERRVKIFLNGEYLTIEIPKDPSIKVVRGTGSAKRD